ncbi:11940_t:CDS:2 [Funneliformis geosporum]|uniref:11940_t:CDS:1 n=1 Tax=Funneliformis geosporum TaxID=1117311 RepID=A0A9W4SPE9_9GLOM|nr:11940_t:CDS:2 [Funneliformis geosporum]
MREAIDLTSGSETTRKRKALRSELLQKNLLTLTVVHGRCPGDFWWTRDVRKSMSGTVSAGQWNKENFKALKATLSQLVHLIRFMEINRADFFDKVRPYKSVIPKNIYEEVEEFHYKGILPRTIYNLGASHKKTFIKNQTKTCKYYSQLD